MNYSWDIKYHLSFLMYIENLKKDIVGLIGFKGLFFLIKIDLAFFFSASLEFGNLDESSLVQTNGSDLNAEDRELLKAYHHSFDDEKVDLDLIMHLLYNICHSCDAGKYVLSKRSGTKCIL